ncbi:hypothetical protein BGZ72_006567 [Mortierella alpina]|nr:hypothetical protein BGZ72_006567 [Mortierella alpina]
MSTQQRLDSEEPDSDFSSLLGRQSLRYPSLPPQQHQQHRHLAAHDPRYSSDADASSDFSSLSEIDLHRDMHSADYSDQELPLGGRWDLAAHWHLGDYSEGVEGDADDDDDEERDIDTDLSEGPGPSGSIFLDLSRVHDILASIPSTTAASAMPPSARTGEPTTALALPNGEADSHSSASEEVAARGTTSIQHHHFAILSPSERTVRFSRDAALPLTPELSTDTALSPVPDRSPEVHTPGQDDVHPDNYNGDMDDSQGDGEAPLVSLPPMAAHNGAYMSAGSGRYSRTHVTGGPFSSTTALELRQHFGVHGPRSSDLAARTGGHRYSALQQPLSPSLGRHDRRSHIHTATAMLSRHLSSSSSARRHLSPYWTALAQYHPISSSRSSISSSPSSSASSSRMPSPGLDSTSTALKSPDGDEPSQATPDRLAPGNEAGHQGHSTNGRGVGAAATRAFTVASARHRRVISSSISSLPSFASSVFTPRGYGADGLGSLGDNKAPRLNHPRRQCCFLQPGQKFHGTQNLKTLTSSLSGMRCRQTEEWDVKVTISAVDYDSGTVYGLMEAMDVPMSASNVVTFWEGEIIDFENHTFWTRKWTAKARTDLEHWKRLEAFNGIDEKYIIRGAKTGKFRGHIDQKYIFMRWKEKHFVNVSEHTGGLTIAGFYYLSMRRSDGFVEGYYHDQQSTPFQHLTLNPTFEAGGFSSPIFELA